MDSKNAYVGEWSPRIRLEAASPHGISQSGLALRAGRASRGAWCWQASPGARVRISGWGRRVAIFGLTADHPRAADRHGSRHAPRRRRVPFPLKTFRPIATIRHLKDLGIEIARWPGGNFVSAYDWRDGIGERDKRPPRRELAWNGME